MTNAPAHLRANTRWTSCTADDCDRKHYAKGVCNKHYQQYRNSGTPLPETDPHPARTWLMNVAYSCVSRRECIDWPFGNKGGYPYGVITFLGRPRGAHESVLLMLGPRPFSRAHASHSCGRPQCVNPEHLSWKTAKQNAADRDLHGTGAKGSSNPRSILTEEQVLEIRARHTAGQGPTEIARDYPVKVKTISAIVNRKAWAWL
jgi:hypothetical protein